MKSFSCFDCFRGQKAQHRDSPQPVRQVPVQDDAEKSTSLPKRVSGELLVSKEAGDSETKDIDDRPEQESSAAVSAPSPKPEAWSPSAEVKIDNPPTTAAEHSNANENIITEQPKATSPEDPATVPQQQSIAEPINRITTSSSSSSHTGWSSGRLSISSLEQISTAATSPPPSPTESEAKSGFAGQTTLDLATSTPLPTSPFSPAKEAPTPLLQPHSEDIPIIITATSASSVTYPATACYSSSSDNNRPILPRLSTTPPPTTINTIDANTNPSKGSNRKNTSRLLSLTRLLSRQTSHEQVKVKLRSKHITLKKLRENLTRRGKGQRVDERKKGSEVVEGVKAEEKSATVRIEGRQWKLDEGDDGASLYCY